jgi:septum formation protein
MKFILASGSPRRRELLASIGLDFDVIPSSVHEVRNEGESVTAYVDRLAREKADEVARRFPDRWVIAADTVVYLDGAVLEKPVDEADARTMLATIAGRQHTVFTGVTLQNLGSGYGETSVMSTNVSIMELQPEDIAWYVSTGEPLDKAGSYAVQGIGAMFIESIEGNYTNVVGLPLSLLRHMMVRAGLDPLRLAAEEDAKKVRMSRG